MSEQALQAPHLPKDEDITRRDFIYVATGAFAAVGAGFTLWPLVDQMNPSADVLAAGTPITVDLSAIEAGQQISVLWRGKPMFIVRRTAEALKELKDPKLLAQLRDPDCAEHQQPDYAKTGRVPSSLNILCSWVSVPILAVFPPTRPSPSSMAMKATSAPATGQNMILLAVSIKACRHLTIFLCRPIVSKVMPNSSSAKITTTRVTHSTRSSRCNA